MLAPLMRNTFTISDRFHRAPSGRCRSLLAAVGFVFIAGCNNGPYTAEVSGQVTLAEKPLTTGKVAFHPVSGGPLAYGAIDASGHYVIRTAGSAGLIPGDYAATVVALAKEPWEGITAEQVDQIRLAPRRYADPATSDHKFTITAGTNQCDIRLQSP